MNLMDLNRAVQTIGHHEHSMALAVSTDFNDRFARLRELLHRDPGAGIWQGLCELIDAWPDGDDLDLALDYTEQHLADRWPDELRLAPWAWWERSCIRGPRSREGGEPRLRLVRALRISLGHRGDDDRAWRLAHSTGLRYVRSLHIINQGAGNHEIRTLVNAEHLESLHILRLSNTAITAAGIAHIVANPRIAKLARLDLCGNNLCGKDIEALAHSPNLSGLQSLDLDSNVIGDRGTIAIASSPYLSKLRELILKNNNVGPAGAKALINQSKLRALSELDLGRNPIRDDGVCALADAPQFATLRTLRLKRSEFGDKGACALAASPYLARLKRLDLLDNPIGDTGARALAESPYLGHLVQLRLSRHHLTHSGLLALANSAQLAPTLIAALTQPVGFLTLKGDSTAYPLYQGGNTIGSNKWADIPLPDPDTLARKRIFCRIHYSEGTFTLLDKDSPSDGARINGQAMNWGHLFHGDTITVGTSTLKLNITPRCQIHPIR